MEDTNEEIYVIIIDGKIKRYSKSRDSARTILKQFTDKVLYHLDYHRKNTNCHSYEDDLRRIIDLKETGETIYTIKAKKVSLIEENKDD